MTDNNILQCTFSNEHALFLSFMPFVKDGGLFIHTKHVYELETPVTLAVTFLDAQHIIAGKVIWITPKGAQGNKPAGIGIQFVGENKRQMCNIIKTLLAGKLTSAQSTNTM